MSWFKKKKICEKRPLITTPEEYEKKYIGGKQNEQPTKRHTRLSKTNRDWNR